MRAGCGRDLAAQETSKPALTQTTLESYPRAAGQKNTNNGHRNSTQGLLNIDKERSQCRKSFITYLSWTAVCSSKQQPKSPPYRERSRREEGGGKREEGRGGRTPRSWTRERKIPSFAFVDALDNNFRIISKVLHHGEGKGRRAEEGSLSRD